MTINYEEDKKKLFSFAIVSEANKERYFFAVSIGFAFFSITLGTLGSSLVKDDEVKLWRRRHLRVSRKM